MALPRKAFCVPLNKKVSKLRLKLFNTHNKDSYYSYKTYNCLF